MSQYIPDLTERFQEGMNGVDLTRNYFPEEGNYAHNVSINYKEDTIMNKVNEYINEIVTKMLIAYPEKAEDNAPVYVNNTVPVSVEEFKALCQCVRKYDVYTAYIENTKQMRRAEEANDRYEQKFVSIVSKYVTVNKAYLVLLNNNNFVENNVAKYLNDLFQKEEETMVTTTNNDLKEVLMNGTKVERMVQVLEFCEQVKNLHDDRYVKKEVLADFLFDNDIIGRKLSAKELKKTKRDELIDTLRTAINSLKKAGVITPVNTKTLDKVLAVEEQPVYLMDNPETFVVKRSKGMLIAERIVKGGKDRNGKSHSAAMFKATKSKDANIDGMWMVTMSKLYAIIADVYDIPNNEDTREKTDTFIKKGVINYLCKNGWLTFKKYEGGALNFFPTKKMVELFQ